MSSECGMLFLITLLCVSGSLGESINVSCSPQTICALRGSVVKLTCSYQKNTKSLFWFSFKQKAKWRTETHPEDLALDSDYTGRVNFTKTTNSKSTLTIQKLRKNDSGEYHLMIITEQGKKYASSAVTITAADLQLKMTQSGQKVTLTCSTSCSLTYKPSFYFWYKNKQYTNIYTPYNKPQPLVLSSRADAGSYSCSVKSNSTLRSSPVSVIIEDSKMGVSYTERKLCILEGLSVDFLCTYSHPKAERVNKAFWFYFRPEVESEELSEEEQFAGRVEFIEDKERNCTLRMRDVRERDSGEYRFQFSTQSGEKFTGSPGVTLEVAALQVRVISSKESGGQTVTLMCSSTCTLPNNPTYIWYKNRQRVTSKLTRDKKLYLKCSEDAGNYSCAVRGHEELRSPEQTFSDCAEDPEESAVLSLVTVGLVVFLPLILITAALWMCCVIRRKRGAQRDTGIQTPDPADHTYTALNPTPMTSDYDTLTHLTDSPSDTYTALNPESMSSDYDTLTHLTDSPSDTYTALNPETMCPDYDTLTGVKASHSEQHEVLQREAPSADYENFQGHST